MDRNNTTYFKINKSTIVLTVTILIISSLIVSVTSQPVKNVMARTTLQMIDDTFEVTKEQREQVEMCYQDDDLMELCQRCAKATKAIIVFPMCCGDEDNATSWCKEYVYYGDD